MAEVISMPGIPMTPEMIVAELSGVLPEIASIVCVVRYLDGSYSMPRSRMQSAEMAMAGGVLIRDAVDSLERR